MIFIKDPDAILDYAVDWSRWLAGDLIAASSWTVPSGLSKVAETNTITRAAVWLAGGAAGQAYVVTNRITTVNGRVDERSITIRVEER